VEDDAQHDVAKGHKLGLHFQITGIMDSYISTDHVIHEMSSAIYYAIIIDNNYNVFSYKTHVHA